MRDLKTQDEPEEEEGRAWVVDRDQPRIRVRDPKSPQSSVVVVLRNRPTEPPPFGE